jgi:hypothetical protein
MPASQTGIWRILAYPPFTKNCWQNNLFIVVHFIRAVFKRNDSQKAWHLLAVDDCQFELRIPMSALSASQAALHQQ